MHAVIVPHSGASFVIIQHLAPELALKVSGHAYVLPVGRNALSGPARDLANDPNVQKVYLGL